MNKAKLIYHLLRSHGLKWCLFRCFYACKVRSGWFRLRCPASDWGSINLEKRLTKGTPNDAEKYLEYRRADQAPKFFFSSRDQKAFRACFDRWDQERTPVEEADKILKGRFRFYSSTEIDVGFPPDWHRNAFTGEQAPADRHWSQLGDFAFGDIKNIWELSRFGWAYTLVRAYWRTSNESYAEAFWELFEDWVSRNPPNQGVNWKCGQEISFRIMAWCFALYGLLDSPATTGARLQKMLLAVAVSGERIAANIEYAISQNNNHGISEGMGLWTIGTLFPELNNAARWQSRGKKVLEQLAQTLIYDDGSFSQHSMNYHRVMLHDYVWAIRLGEFNDMPLSASLLGQVSMAGEFLYHCQDETSGQLPLYGPNDGTLVLPLSNCDFLDFRPVIQTTQLLCGEFSRFETGPWDEDVLWLRGKGKIARQCGVRPNKWKAPEGGYYVWRGKESMVFCRCGPLRHRPQEPDFLHIDLWWKGENIALDPGTYSYNAPPPWNRGFKATGCHNTVNIDNADQMEKVSAFLWLPWIQSSVSADWEGGCGVSYWEGRHSGYRKSNESRIHRRGVAYLGEESWLVFDRVLAESPCLIRIHWLLIDDDWSWNDDARGLMLKRPHGNLYLRWGELAGEYVFPENVRARTDDARGWRSRYYQRMEPALSLSLEMRRKESWTWALFSPQKTRCEVNGTLVTLYFEERIVKLQLDPESDSSMIEKIIVDSTSNGSAGVSQISNDRPQ